jgi:hypothetical protein
MPTRSGWRLLGSWPDKLEVILPVLVFVAMVLSGFSTSSMRLLFQDPAVGPEGQIGEALPIRSDEWLTAAPIELSTLANGSSMTSPLTNGPDLIYQVSSGTPIETVLFHEGNLLRLGPWLPDEMLFSAFRGYHWLLLALFLPPLLRRLGANRPVSWLAVGLTLLAPAAIWWSFMPIRILGLAAAGSYVLLLGRDRLVRRHWVRGLALSLLAGLLLARLVTYYVPWSLTVGVPLVIATGLHMLLTREQRRAAMIAIATGATFAVVMLVGVFWENWAALSAELNTVYPGQRRSTGAALPPFQLFGGPGLFELEDYAAPIGTNQSEASSAYLVTALAALALWPAVRHRVPRPEKAAIAVLAGATLLFSSWAMVAWGSFGSSIPGLSVLMPVRTAQTVGFTATLLFCLVLGAWARQRAEDRESGLDARTDADLRKSRALLAAALVGVVTAYGVSDLQRPIPELPAGQVWLATLVMTALVYVVVRWPSSWIPAVLAATVGVAAHVDANPIVFGLGDLRDSAAADRARAFRVQATTRDTLMVTDSMAANALLVANGVPLLSGYQVTGPNREEWEKLDPEVAYEGVWNRGASYLIFSFDKPKGAPPEIIAEAPDVIRVQVDPCWLTEGAWPVERIVSDQLLESKCVKEVNSFMWQGVTQRVYDLKAR